MKKYWYRFHAKVFVNRKLKFIDWFFSRYPDKYCWADCVAWAYNSGRFNPFKIESSKGCKMESETHPTELCYCGGWNNGVCWHNLSKEEQDKRREEYTYTEVENNPPF